MDLVEKEILDRVKISIFEFAEIIKEENYNLYNKLINNWDSIKRLFLDFDDDYKWPMLKHPNFSCNFGLKKNTANKNMDRLIK